MPCIGGIVLDTASGAGKILFMQNEFIPLLLLMLVAAVICTAMVTLSWVLGPKKNTPYKASPYECGVEPSGNANERFPIKFYLVAILFVMFDIEVVFLWSWLTVFNNPATDINFKVFSFVEVLVYLSTWIVGYAYVLRVGAIDWDETTSLHPEKLGAKAEVN